MSEECRMEWVIITKDPRALITDLRRLDSVASARWTKGQWRPETELGAES